MPRAKLNGALHNGVTVKVCLYLRMSDPRQDVSIDRQKVACVQYCRERGYEIVAIYIDEGISGDDIARRLQFKQMVQECPDAPWSIIVCDNFERFSRMDIIDAGEWIAPLRRADKTLETVADGPINWESFTDLMMVGFRTGKGKDHLIGHSRIVLGGMLEAAKAGKNLGPIARGYKKVVRTDESGKILESTIVFDESEHQAPIIRQIFQWALEGWSTSLIAAELNRRGVPPTSPKSLRWSATSVLGILKNRYYLGEYRWGRRSDSSYNELENGKAVPVPRRLSGKRHRKIPAKEVTFIPNNHPAMIDQETFDAVRAGLTSRNKMTSPRRGKDSFCFSKLLKCGKCGSTMYGCRARDAEGAREYRCAASRKGAGCMAHTVPEKVLLDMVLTGLVEHLKDPVKVRKFRAAAQEQINLLRKQFDATAVQNRLAGVRAKLAKARKNLAFCETKAGFEAVEASITLLSAQESGMLDEIKQLEAAGKMTMEDYDRQLQRMVRQAEVMSREAPETAPDALRADLAEMIEHVEVHVAATVGAVKYRRYILKHAVVKTTLGEDLFCEHITGKLAENDAHTRAARTAAPRKCAQFVVYPDNQPIKAAKARALTGSM